jgi:hypothetical protein
VVNALQFLDKTFVAETDNVFADPNVIKLFVDLMVVVEVAELVPEMPLVSADNVLTQFLDVVETVSVGLEKTLAAVTLIVVVAVSTANVKRTLEKLSLIVSRIVSPLFSLKSERDRAISWFKNNVPSKLQDQIITVRL